MYLAFDNPRTSQHDTVRMDGALKTALGRHIVVAWNSSRPVARSLNDAIPLIEKADRTTILMVNPSGFIDSHEGPPGEQLAEHITSHGCPCGYYSN